MTGALSSDKTTGRTVLLAWLILSAILTITAASRIMSGQLPDPDDALRLVQVRDLIGGQGWFDMVQYRIDPPTGTPMHWSRLVDIPLLTVTLLLGEGAALVIVPLLTLGAVLWCVGKLAARLCGGEVVLFACLVCGFIPALLMQLQPMRIDHHGWQVASVALAMLAIAGSHARGGAALAGAAMAFGMSVSLELLPIAAILAAVLAARWWRKPHAAIWLITYLQVLAIGLVVLFLATRGTGAPSAWCDAVSPPQLVFFAVIALGATGLAATKPTRAVIAAGLALTGLTGVGALALIAPQCLAPPFAGLDPLVRDYWYVHIAEGQPLWQRPAAEFLPAMVQMVAALAACAMLWRQSTGAARVWWAEHAAVLLGALVLGLLVSRSLAFAAVIAAVPLGWLAVRLLGRMRAASGLGLRGAAALMIVLVLVPSAPVTVANQLSPAVSVSRPASVASAACDVRDRAASLRILPRGVVFAPLDMGPAILLETRHAVVATSHHRAEAAMADVIRAFIAPPDHARAVVASHGADYLALCTDLAEPALYAARHPEGLAALLASDSGPNWLEPVDALSTPEFRVYRVRLDETPSPPR
ncbi:MAG: hypothetical protein B7X57_03395 [Erythrobacter sp. 34-65-8]|nr:MAG: hypothetical protein B7X57_03395 [Erythrobacter sp. 34-65-8]